MLRKRCREEYTICTATTPKPPSPGDAGHPTRQTAPVSAQIRASAPANLQATGLRPGEPSTSDKTQVSPVGIFFSGIAFIGVAVALLIQQRELQNQHDEISIAREEQARASEVVMRQLHTDLIKMAIEDPELLTVWPDMAPGIAGSKKDQYCNPILNLQKVAYETHTIELAELRGALRFLMTSRDMYLFWKKVRTARVAVTGGDRGEDFFTSKVDRAFNACSAPPRRAADRFREALTVLRRRQ